MRTPLAIVAWVVIALAAGWLLRGLTEASAPGMAAPPKEANGPCE